MHGLDRDREDHSRRKRLTARSTRCRIISSSKHAFKSRAFYCVRKDGTDRFAAVVSYSSCTLSTRFFTRPLCWIATIAGFICNFGGIPSQAKAVSHVLNFEDIFPRAALRTALRMVWSEANFPWYSDNQY